MTMIFKSFFGEEEQFGEDTEYILVENTQKEM